MHCTYRNTSVCKHMWRGDTRDNVNYPPYRHKKKKYRWRFNIHPRTCHTINPVIRFELDMCHAHSTSEATWYCQCDKGSTSTTWLAYYYTSDGWLQPPNIRWPESNITPGMTHKERLQVESQLDLTKMLLMDQIMLSPMRHKNVLGFCFTINVEIIHNIDISPPVYSDHNTIELTVYGPELTKYKLRMDGAQTLSRLNFYMSEWMSSENICTNRTGLKATLCKI